MSTITTPPEARPRPTRAAGVSLLAAGPACIACGMPFIWPALAAIGLGVPLSIAHGISWVLVPVIVALLAVNARRHRQRGPLQLAAAGALVYALHVVTHYVSSPGDVTFLLTDHVAVALLGGAALWDLSVTRRVRARVPMVRRDGPRAAARAR